MALIDFQKALYDLISNPSFCIRIRVNGQELLDRYALTDKEYYRLKHIANQKGMDTNCTLYRINRVTPIYTMMPYTCKLLGNQLLPILSIFWDSNDKTNLQFKDEVALFYTFLRKRIEEGFIQIKYLVAILEMEGKLNELRFGQLSSKTIKSGETFSLQPHIRVVYFSVHPKKLFQYLTQEEVHKDTELPFGDFYLIIEQVDEEITMKIITKELGKILTNIENYKELPAEIMQSGLVREIHATI